MKIGTWSRFFDFEEVFEYYGVFDENSLSRRSPKQIDGIWENRTPTMAFASVPMKAAGGPSVIWPLNIVLMTCRARCLMEILDATCFE